MPPLRGVAVGGATNGEQEQEVTREGSRSQDVPLASAHA